MVAVRDEGVRRADDQGVLRWTVGSGGFIGEVSLLQVPARYADTVQRINRGKPLLLLGNLYVHPLRRGLGWSHGLLQAACAYADANGIDLWLYASPFGARRTARGPVSRLATTDLVALYEHHGFTQPKLVVYNNEMVRRCRPV